MAMQAIATGAKTLAGGAKKLGVFLGKNGGGISSIMGLFSNGSSNSARALKDQYTYNLDLQNRQNDFTREMMLNKYQWQVEDLKKAGINPLYGLGNAPIGSSGMASVGLPDYAGEVNGKKQRILEAINTAINFSAAKANIEKTEAETRTENINTNLKKLESIGKQIENIKAKKELKWYDKFQLAQLKKLESETIVNMKMSAKIEQEALNAQEYRKNIVQERYNLRETKENIKADTENKKQENALNSFDEKYIKEHPILYSMGIDRNTGKSLGAAALGLMLGTYTGKASMKFAKKSVKARTQANRTYSARKKSVR